MDLNDEALFFHREEIPTRDQGICNVYALMDLGSAFCFGAETFIEAPTVDRICALLRQTQKLPGAPRLVFASRKEPYPEVLEEACQILDLKFTLIADSTLKPYTKFFSESFRNQMNPSRVRKVTRRATAADIEEAMPQAYDPCPCSSGQKYRFCCQKIFKYVARAMLAAQDGKKSEALKILKEAEAISGRTAEIVLREAIIWSMFDQGQSYEFLLEAESIDPFHPRLQYIKGIGAMEKGDPRSAVKFYKKAIEYYPQESKFYLNETYNNLGTAYYHLKKFKDAKDAWEKALVYFPKDEVVRQNLEDQIYGNPEIPDELREISPFMKKFYDR